MKTRNNRILNLFRILTGSLIVLLLIGLTTASAQKKRSTRGKSNAARQFQFVTVEGVTFKIPSSWKKNPFSEKSWNGGNDVGAYFSVYMLTDEDVRKAGNFSIEDDLRILYETEKKYGAEDVRLLEIGGVKGVHFLREDEEISRVTDKLFARKSVRWVFEREYQGKRQLGNIWFSSPAKDFSKNKAMFYDLLNSIRFARDKP